MPKPRLTSEEATTIVIDAVCAITGNDGPAPTADAVKRIRTGDLATSSDDYEAVQGIELKGFAAEDCDALKPQLDDIWDKILELLRRWWKSHAGGAPFPSSDPDQPDPWGCDTTIGDIVTQLLVWNA